MSCFKVLPQKMKLNPHPYQRNLINWMITTMQRKVITGLQFMMRILLGPLKMLMKSTPNQEKNEREEPKGIVFLSKLLLLFQYCHICFTPNPEVTALKTRTLLTIETKCNKCKEIFTCKSQPFLLGKFPAGNLLLSFAVLCAGASIKKVLLVFIYNQTQRILQIH